MLPKRVRNGHNETEQRLLLHYQDCHSIGAAASHGPRGNIQ